MTPTPPESPSKPPLDEVGAIRALIDAVKSRVVSGLILALPIALTFWIIYQLYKILNDYVLWPVSWCIRYLLRFKPGTTVDSTWTLYVSPLIAIVLVLVLLYILGLFVRSGFHRAVAWILMRFPVVSTVYKVVDSVFQSLDMQKQQAFKRVVLVEFPHPGIKALAFVTKTLTDVSTDRTILCVCVLTGVLPPSGFTLFVPEEDVVDVDWSMNQSLQTIMSGGITAPAMIHYTQGLRVPPTGPIVDPSGHPIISGENGD